MTMANPTMVDNDSVSDNGSVDTGEDARTSRLDNCVFNPIDLNSDNTKLKFGSCMYHRVCTDM